MPRRLASSLLAALLVGLAQRPPWSQAAVAPSAVQSWQLDNGLRLCVRPAPTTASVAVVGFVTVSLAEEPPGREGVRDLLQLCLASAVPPAAARAGIVVAGQTQPDFVALGARGPESAWRLALATVLDLLFKAHFDALAIRTQQAILRRLEEVRAAQITTSAQRWGEESLYPVLVSRRQLGAAWAAFSPTSLAAFYQRYFVPNRVLLVVSGPLAPEEVYKEVAGATAALLPGQYAPSRGLLAAPAQEGRRRVVLGDSEAVVWVGARAPTPASPEYPVAVVAATALGEGMGSRLFRRLRDELGIAYTVEAQVMTRQLCPYMYVLCTCAAADLSRARSEMEEQLDLLAREPLGGEELERAREFAATQARLLELSNWDAAHYLGAMGLLAPGQPHASSAAVLAEEMRQVSAEQVQAFVRNWWSKRVVVEVTGQ
jgi:zinc protease